MGRVFSMVDEWEMYIPNIDGGSDREDFANDPEGVFSVEIRFLNAAQVRGYERILKKAKSASQIDKAAAEYAERLFCENVRNVKNYAPNGEPIRTGEDMWALGEPHVIDDISAALRNRSVLEDGLGKRLSSPSDTTS